MKYLLSLLCLLPLSFTTLFAQASPRIVQWHGIEGVITAQGVDNPISNNIHSGTFAWTTHTGAAIIDLQTGATAFRVEGLVINGARFSGTHGPVPAVVGTLVCDPGDTTRENTHDTSPVPLNGRGNAQFAGRISVPSSCSHPLFLLRIANLPGANGLWIATGTERSITF